MKHNQQQHDENGIHRRCVAYLDGFCMLKTGPEHCYNGGDYNTCIIRHPHIWHNNQEEQKDQQEALALLRKILSVNGVPECWMDSAISDINKVLDVKTRKVEA